MTTHCLFGVFSCLPSGEMQCDPMSVSVLHTSRKKHHIRFLILKALTRQTHENATCLDVKCSHLKPSHWQNTILRQEHRKTTWQTVLIGHVYGLQACTKLDRDGGAHLFTEEQPVPDRWVRPAGQSQVSAMCCHMLSLRSLFLSFQSHLSTIRCWGTQLMSLSAIVVDVAAGDTLSVPHKHHNWMRPFYSSLFIPFHLVNCWKQTCL